jgi:hypothetical protein
LCHLIEGLALAALQVPNVPLSGSEKFLLDQLGTLELQFHQFRIKFLFLKFIEVNLKQIICSWSLNYFDSSTTNPACRTEIGFQDDWSWLKVENMDFGIFLSRTWQSFQKDLNCFEIFHFH